MNDPQFPSPAAPGALAPATDPATNLPLDPATAQSLATAAAIMARLRAPNGCPWDLEQTFDSIKKHTLEETYEVFDAIERRAWPDLQEELGDLLLQVLFYAQMAADAGHFSLRDVADTLNSKLIRRHPHIFAAAQAPDSETVLRNWEQIKREEKSARPQIAQGPAKTSTLDSIPRSMPAILEAHKLGSAAAKLGFDWPDAAGLFTKLHEEIAELRAELPADLTHPTPQINEAAEEELGDLLFTAINLARHLHLDPESALRRTNRKFRQRFAAMEAAAGDAAALQSLTPDELEALWSRAKASLKAQAAAQPTSEAATR